jgi:hypothetical protein
MAAPFRFLGNGTKGPGGLFNFFYIAAAWSRRGPKIAGLPVGQRMLVAEASGAPQSSPKTLGDP